jgi:hypothetical protein
VPPEPLERASKKASRQMARLGKLLEKHDTATGLSGQHDQPLQPVLALATEYHRSQKT